MLNQPLLRLNGILSEYLYFHFRYHYACYLTCIHCAYKMEISHQHETEHCCQQCCQHRPKTPEKITGDIPVCVLSSSLPPLVIQGTTKEIFDASFDSNSFDQHSLVKDRAKGHKLSSKKISNGCVLYLLYHYIL